MKLKNFKTKFDFFIIGVQKCGTSYLKFLLEQHSELYSHSSPEFSFFNDIHFGRKKTISDWFNEHFVDFYENKNKMIFGKNVDIFTCDNSLKRLINHNPNIKIIILLRDPIKRIVSSFDYCYARGVENNRDFSAVIREDKRYIDNYYKFINCNYISTSKYSDHLDRIYSQISPKNIYLISFESLIENPKKNLNNILNFLGLKKNSHNEIKFDRVINKASTSLFPKLNLVLHIKNTKFNKLWKKIPIRFRVRLIQFFINLNSKKKINKTLLNKSDSLYLNKIFSKEYSILKNKYFIDFDNQV